MRPLIHRFEISVSLLALGPQRAHLLPSVTAAELIAAIEAEFQAELQQQGQAPGGYQLVLADGGHLDEALPLSRQLTPKAQLHLIERRPALAQPVGQPALLEEVASGRRYRLAWQPALIGRPAGAASDNELLAVDLADHPQGLRVSRRQARLTEQAGYWLVESLSTNPMSLASGAAGWQRLDAGQHRLDDGARLRLDHSGIEFRIILASDRAAALAAL